MPKLTKSNLDLRGYMASKGVTQAQVAGELGVNRASLSAQMQYELPKERKAEIRAAVDRVASRG